MKLAIVVPTFNEEGPLAASLTRARGSADLLIVSDGGSSDRSVEVARSMAQVVRGELGRGRQLNLGAEAALDGGADVLLFLHADTLLPSMARRLIEEAIGAGAVGGGFAVRFDDQRSMFRLGAKIVNLRTRALSMPLGDQAQFVTARTFRNLGGFENWPILEDLDFILRMRRQGELAIVEQPVVTAARRFTERGIIRTVATNWLIWLLFLFGVKPARLARLYPSIR